MCTVQVHRMPKMHGSCCFMCSVLRVIMVSGFIQIHKFMCWWKFETSGFLGYLCN